MAYLNPNSKGFVISTGACTEAIIWGHIKVLPKIMVAWFLKTYTNKSWLTTPDVFSSDFTSAGYMSVPKSWVVVGS